MRTSFNIGLITIIIFSGFMFPESRSETVGLPLSGQNIQFAKDVQLINAAKNGDLQAVKQYVTNGANVNASDSDIEGETVLIHAVEGKPNKKPEDLNTQKEIIKFLLEHGASVNRADKISDTPITKALFIPSASKTYRMEIIKLLAENGADINYMNRTESSAWRTVVLEEKLADVQFLAQYGANMQMPELLEYALRNQTVDRDAIVKYLVNQGTSLQEREADRPLILWAALRTTPDLLEFLIAHGLNIKARGKDGNSALFFAQDAERLKFLLSLGVDAHTKDNAGYSVLFSAKNVDMAKILLEAGLSVNDKSNDGNTPLISASDSGDTCDPQLLQFLIANGANVNARNNLGESAIHKSNNFECLKVLVENGANVNAKTNFGETPLMRRVRNIDEMRYLISKGADPFAIDSLLHRNLLHHAVEAGTLESLKYVVSLGVDPNQKNIDPFLPTPLMIAAIRGRSLDVVNAILQSPKKVDVTIKNGFGKDVFSVKVSDMYDMKNWKPSISDGCPPGSDKTKEIVEYVDAHMLPPEIEARLKAYQKHPSGK